MGQIVACANQKGGVGKTTTVVNLGTYLALLGERVLVVDLDSQGNATSGFGVDKSRLDRSVYDALVDDIPLAEIARPTAIRGLDLVPAAVSLAGAEVELTPLAQRERRLTRLTEAVASEYDYVLLDCPPSLGLLTVNALTAADSVLIPIQCEYYALEGLTQLVATINLIRDHLNPALTITGVVLTMYDARTNLSAEVAAEVRRHLGDRVYDTVIPRSVRLSEAPSFGKPVALYRDDSKGAQAYRALAAEVRRRDRRRAKAEAIGETPTLVGEPGMTVRAERTGALGRGLAALIPQRPSPAGPTEIPIARIRSNPYQPRRRVDQATLQDLAASIREHGVLQPILVTEQLDGYQLVAGERRVRAAQLAGLERIPAVIRQLADRDQLELAIVENVQRADLTAVEEAHAYRQLIDEFGFSQDQIASRVGRARPTVANTLRLLDLPEDVQDAVGEGRISPGHARALLGLPGSQQRQIVEVIESRDLSVRQTEELARRLRERPTVQSDSPKATRVDPDLERVEEDLRQALGTKVSLARTRRGGRIVIEYYSDEELNRLYERLTSPGAVT